jgi:hypothetical protein
MVIMKRSPLLALSFAFAALLIFAALSAHASTLNGIGDNQTDLYGSYYIITGGKIPVIAREPGGLFSFLSDDPDNGDPIDSWQNEVWFEENSGLALTLKNRTSIVFDNNGIEDNTYGSYYNENLSGNDHGLYKGYSMSNNFDWIYAGYFKLDQATIFDTLIGYFDGNGSDADPYPFNPASPHIADRMNIWSNVDDGLLPVNTGGFSGNVFSSDNVGGTFSWSDTGVVRVFSDGSTDPIYRLAYSLDSPVTLQAGIYWFSHDAAVVAPEPAALVLFGTGLVALAFIRMRNARMARKKKAGKI